MKANTGASHFIGCVEHHQVVFAAFSGSSLQDIGAEQLNAPDAVSFKSACLALLPALGYGHQPISLLLPTSFATCRSVTIPATRQEEIEKIAAFQAHRFLPAALGALVTGFQVLAIKHDGTADINLVIAPTGVIEQYVGVLKGFAPAAISITIQALGIFSLFNSLRLLPREPAYIIGVNGGRIECSIASSKGLYVCRSFDAPGGEPEFESSFTAEMRKITETYQKENSSPAPSAALVFGNPRLERTAELVARSTGNSPTIVELDRHIHGQAAALAAGRDRHYPLAAISGIGMARVPDSLNLVTDDIKQAQRRDAEKKNMYQAAFFGCLALALFFAAFMADLGRKRVFLKSLKEDIHSIEKEAKEVESLESMASYARESSSGFPPVIETLKAAFDLTPPGMTLENLLYEPENRQIVFKGQAGRLSDVFTFVSNIEGDSRFDGFKPKINYATEQQGRSKTTIIFELSCSKAE